MKKDSFKKIAEKIKEMKETQEEGEEKRKRGRPTLSMSTKIKQKNFINAYVITGNISVSCDYVEMDRGTYYKWIKKKSFLKMLDEAIERKKDSMESLYENKAKVLEKANHNWLCAKAPERGWSKEKILNVNNNNNTNKEKELTDDELKARITQAGLVPAKSLLDEIEQESIDDTNQEES